jgi:hypothetical protein
MNKLELIDMLKNECRLSKKEAAAVVDLFFDSMTEALAKGARVEIRGLCSFFVKEYRWIIEPLILGRFLVCLLYDGFAGYNYSQ